MQSVEGEFLGECEECPGLSSFESLVEYDPVPELEWIDPELFSDHQGSDALLAQESSSDPGSFGGDAALAALVLLQRMLNCSICHFSSGNFRASRSSR